MNYVKLELKDEDNKIHEVDKKFESPQLIINDKYISNICEKLEIKTLT